MPGLKLYILQYSIKCLLVYLNQSHKLHFSNLLPEDYGPLGCDAIQFGK
jgi:hypothetical protein